MESDRCLVEEERRGVLIIRGVALENPPRPWNWDDSEVAFDG